MALIFIAWLVIYIQAVYDTIVILSVSMCCIGYLCQILWFYYVKHLGQILIINGAALNTGWIWKIHGFTNTFLLHSLLYAKNHICSSAEPVFLVSINLSASLDYVAWAVCLSACHSSQCCKNGWTDREAVWVEEPGGPKEALSGGCAHWCHLANTTEPPMCGGNAACCQISLTSCSV